MSDPGVHACPSCTHPWTAHGRDGCAYAEPGGCWCGNTGAATPPVRDGDARILLEQALHLCQHGERAPGCGPWPAETWPEWARRAEEWLRAEPVREPVDVDGLVSDEMVQRALGGARSVGADPSTIIDYEMRAALCSVAADLYEQGREDGRGDLIWHEERVRRECADELRILRRDGSQVATVWLGTEVVVVAGAEVDVLADRWSTDPGQESGITQWD